MATLPHPPLQTIALRADGSTSMGLGHIFNSLAVADALQSLGVEVYYITRSFPAAVEKLQERGYLVETISPFSTEEESFTETLKILVKKKTTFLITDLLEIGQDYSPELRKHGIWCISFDILGKIALQSDLIFNRTTLAQRFGAYKNNGRTRYYLGPQYVPLDKQYFGLEKKEREINSRIQKVLVCFGGGDEFNLTTRVVRILSSFPFHVTLVLGKAFRGYQELNEAILSIEKKPLVLRDAQHMAELMQQADLAICAGGSILYELAITGTPTLVLPMNEHQVENGEEAQKWGSVVALGLHTTVSDEEIRQAVQRIAEDPSLRKKMCDAGKKIIDGRGAERAAEIIYAFVKMRRADHCSI